MPPKRSCKACHGTGWAQAPVGRSLEREDGSKMDYSGVVRCACENSITIPDDPPAAPLLDRQSRAAGEQPPPAVEVCSGCGVERGRHLEEEGAPVVQAGEPPQPILCGEWRRGGAA